MVDKAAGTQAREGVPSLAESFRVFIDEQRRLPKYSECSKKTQVARAKILQSVAEYLAGGDAPSAVIRDANGEPDVVGAIKSLCNDAKDSKSSCARTFKVNMLQLVVPHYSLKALKDMGFTIGKKLYSTASQFASGGGGDFDPTKEAGGGRPTQPHADTIAAEWIGRAVATRSHSGAEATAN